MIAVVLSMFPAQNPEAVYRMTDREIAAYFFPDEYNRVYLDCHQTEALTYRDAFWHIAKARGMTESEIVRAWAKQEGSGNLSG